MTRYFHQIKHVPSQYKYVHGDRFPDGTTQWAFYYHNDQKSKTRKITGSKAGFATERDAAIAVDKFLISIGMEPVNILKRKAVA